MSGHRGESAGVFVARDLAGAIRGAMLVQSLPGALGIALPPRAETAEMADALVLTACDWLRNRGVKVCQAFGSDDELPEMAALERNGFRRVTRLVTLQRDLEGEEAGQAQVQTRLSFRNELPPLSRELTAVLLATYEGSLDCPELNGRRTADELAASFADQPAETAWYLAADGGDSIGAVILTAQPNSGAMELSYLGVVPAFRGRGVGGHLLEFALSEAHRRRSRAVTASVDVRNTIALRLYGRNGFVERDSSWVFIADLQLPASCNRSSAR
ncbi:MAG TPA: GNAT family N-acetyltransferase [Gemmata sp.]|nr:GNAT family N-acetyltransferase [Gemmata sp.]